MANIGRHLISNSLVLTMDSSILDTSIDYMRKNNVPTLFDTVD